MTTADGSVLGAVKIVDNGPDYLRYTIGLLPDGYTAAEMPKWETDAQAAVDRLLSEAPFSDLELRCAFNVYRVDVISDEAGADDPKCGGPGLGSKAATYFDATFCAEKDLRRSMDFDSETAVLTLLAHVPLWRMGVVIVNSPVQGGTGGTIPVMSTGGSDWLHGFVHELGHSAFGLADEYEYLAGCATSEEHYLHDSVEPIEPNVTANLGPADFPLVKWGALIDPATPIPTTTNPTCNICDPATSSPLAGTVGAYEGAHYYHCRAWRPDFDCMMRTIRGSFCAVCQGVIRAVLAPFANPVVVTPLSTTVTFADTEAGTTVPSSVAFTVESCVDLTFVVRDGPRRIDGGPADYAGAPVLDLPFGNSTSSEAVPGGGARTANVWVTYQATEPGDLLLGFITVECAETGEFFSFLITGNTVAPVTVGVLLCLDESASMLEPATGSESKGVALQQAAEILVDVIGAAEGIGVITFSTDASGAPVIDAGEGLFGAGRVSARNDIASYAPDPQGLTSLGDAVERADAILAGAASRYDGTAMVVFTDGKETASKYLSEVTGLISANTKIFAVGLGTAANLDPAALDTLCGGSGGELLLTGTDPGDTFFLLAKYFLNILAGATNTEIVSDPAGYLVNGAAPCRIPFTLNETDTSVDAILVTPVPTAVRFAIETPTGEVITPTTPVPGTSYVQGRTQRPLPGVPARSDRTTTGARGRLVRRAEHQHGCLDRRRQCSAALRLPPEPSVSRDQRPAVRATCPGTIESLDDRPVSAGLLRAQR